MKVTVKSRSKSKPPLGNLFLFRCDVYKQKFYQMHKTLMLNQSKETQIQQKSKQIQLNLNSEGLKLEKAQ